MTVLIKSATILDPQSGHHQKKRDILIENGIIIKISTSIDAPNATLVQRKNLHVSCGWMDSSVCFGEPGFEERETIENGLKTAALSGFIDVVVNPNTNPPVDSFADIAFLKNKALGRAVNLHPMGALTAKSDGKDLAEMFDMKRAGAVAFGDYQKPVSNPNLLKLALLYAQNVGSLVLSFPHESNIAGKGVANEGETATGLGLKGIPALAEELQIARDLFILEYTGGKLHIPTISSAGSVQLIKQAKKKGLDVSCSVAIHNLFFTDAMLNEFDTNYKVLPPLRTKNDVKALVKAVEEGVVDFVTSDHNPLDIEVKKMEFDHAKYGTIGLESAFGALGTLFSAEKCIEILTRNKERFGIENTVIAEGQPAKLTFFDPDFEYAFSETHILSSSKNSAFIGAKLKGRALGIVSNNQLVLHP